MRRTGRQPAVAARPMAPTGATAGGGARPQEAAGVTGLGLGDHPLGLGGGLVLGLALGRGLEVVEVTVVAMGLVMEIPGAELVEEEEEEEEEETTMAETLAGSSS
ncbi:hypothetical protein L3X38_014664 [Prunus dulcis]|uniref:Uncharacterized protein n=1 Tax=Prunus dulcis TaxID=3755 RepID=A0AAD4WNM0_PRUDU|nr:hypothetical protein L3X38_014664 [Prunus dulcis]